MEIASKNIKYEVSAGSPGPLGATISDKGVNFSVISMSARNMSLVLAASEHESQTTEIPLDPKTNRNGDVWHIFVYSVAPGTKYAYRVNDQPQLLIDPYARYIYGNQEWAIRKHSPFTDSDFKLCGQVVKDDFEWGEDAPLNIPLADSIIYEMHVRGFTQSESSGVEQPGTYAAVVEKIPYLRSLGITAVELLPIFAFDETRNIQRNPETGEALPNFWGYDPVNFFAPMAAYAGSGRSAITEFKSMVKALHAAGIEVILDVVYNHTAEGGDGGDIFSFKGLDDNIYYIKEGQSQRYKNYSGCGNTVSCNHPVVREMIIASLQYWVKEMHVDGFRFDLASILCRGSDGRVLKYPPVIEEIASDPVLANTKLIAEAWDAVGLYQVGTFPAYRRWADWNGKYRDDVRRFMKGDKGALPVVAARVTGSADLYRHDQRKPYHGINFVTSHDGFTLYDLVSYNHKHNAANGEKNRDGSNENFSWNCGREGETISVEVQALRLRQIKNFITMLFVSQGTPMFLAGDERGNSQQGNNNAWCQDNEISWLNWEPNAISEEILNFTRKMIAFRKAHSILRRQKFFEDEPPEKSMIAWHGNRLNKPSWDEKGKLLCFELFNEDGQTPELLAIFNSGLMAQKVELSPLKNDRYWHRFSDTGRTFPEDITGPGKEIEIRNQFNYTVNGHSSVILVAK